MRWSVETLNEVVDGEINALPRSVRARLLRLMESIGDLGLERFHEPHVKHIEGKLGNCEPKRLTELRAGSM